MDGTAAGRERSRATKARQVRERRAQIVTTIGDYWEEHGYAPTRTEIAKAMGLSPDTVTTHVKALIEEGVLTETGPRTLRLAF